MVASLTSTVKPSGSGGTRAGVSVPHSSVTLADVRRHRARRNAGSREGGRANDGRHSRALRSGLGVGVMRRAPCSYTEGLRDAHKRDGILGGSVANDQHDVLRRLLDKDGSIDLVHRYSYCVDHRRYDEVAELFNERCVVDYGVAPPVRGRAAVRKMFGTPAAALRRRATTNANVLVRSRTTTAASVLTSLYAWHRLADGTTPSSGATTTTRSCEFPTAGGSRRQLQVLDVKDWKLEWHWAPRGRPSPSRCSTTRGEQGVAPVDELHLVPDLDVMASALHRGLSVAGPGRRNVAASVARDDAKPIRSLLFTPGDQEARASPRTRSRAPTRCSSTSRSRARRARRRRESRPAGSCASSSTPHRPGRARRATSCACNPSRRG